MKRFDQELTELQHRLVEMGELAESMIATVVRGLEDISIDISDVILKSEDVMDNLQVTIDSEVVRILTVYTPCLLYTSPSPRDRTRSRMPSSA